MTNLTFPSHFLWGTATAPVQNEGSFRESSWWAWERRPAAIRNGDRSGIGCDWWANAEADFDLARSIGHNALRLGVEWSRIQPQEGAVDEAALARYRQMLHGLRARSIEPMLTLHHFSAPMWFVRRGGWRNPAAPAIFGRFVDLVADALGDLVTLWITINEPMVYVRDGFLDGARPPGHSGLPNALRAARHLLLGHGAAYEAIHRRRSDALVGIANHIAHFDPAQPDRGGDRAGARLLDWLFNGWKLAAQTSGRIGPPYGLGALPQPSLVDSIDFLGLNYYSRIQVRYARGGRNEFVAWQMVPLDETVERSDAGLDGFMGEIYPEGMGRALRRLADYGKPIYITENGVADHSDRLRTRFIVSHLAAVQRAIAAGVDVRGYFHWTLVDNFEWSEGWQWRFGLVEMDPATQARRPRPSAAVYERICRANAIPGDLLEVTRQSDIAHGSHR
ncbi:MAG TPA: family 1 glycosylhydrolase [Anaerolineae bacterium]|nr:family 1 glycosylhydrolase [Anaerolineae bacterium]